MDTLNTDKKKKNKTKNILLGRGGRLDEKINMVLCM